MGEAQSSENFFFSLSFSPDVVIVAVVTLPAVVLVVVVVVVINVADVIVSVVVSTVAYIQFFMPALTTYRICFNCIYGWDFYY